MSESSTRSLLILSLLFCSFDSFSFHPFMTVDAPNDCVVFFCCVYTVDVCVCIAFIV